MTTETEIIHGGPASISGYRAHATTSGKQATAMAVGAGGRVRARDGGLFVQEWRDDKIVSNACGIVGQDGIKPDTWYICKDCKLVEADQ